VEHRIGEVLAKYPTPQAMAHASQEAVRADLLSFGLTWRADNLAASARVITREHDGQVPTDTDALLALPGVGPYVASATVAAVEGTSVLLIDTNTVRVATRVSGIHRRGDIRRQRDVIGAVESLLGGAALARDWWAVLDLGALLCTPLNPRCNGCPIQADCLTGQQVSPARDGQACS
jgi:A/G-specific adenine glycosylase